MISEKCFPVVIKIYRNYLLPCYSRPLSLGYHMSFLSRLFNRNKCIVVKRFVVRSWRYRWIRRYRLPISCWK